MRNITFILLLSFAFANAISYGQAVPPVCDQKTNMSTDGECNFANWDWQSLECKNWRAYTAQANLLNMSAPWVKPVGKVAQITTQGDYTKAHGWELITRDFGCYRARPYPYFVLYNKYNGLLRVYIFMSNLTITGFSKMAVTLRHADTYNHPATLASANSPMEAPNQYPGSFRDDMIVFVTDDVPQGNWTVAEFRTSFDPNTYSYPAASALAVGMYGITSSTVKLGNQPVAGPYAFAGSSAIFKDQNNASTSPDGQAGDAKKIISDGKKIMETLKLTKELVDAINAKAEKTKTDSEAPAKVKEDAGKVQNEANSGGFKKTLGTISGILGVINPALALMGNVAGYLWADSESTPYSPSTSINNSMLNGFLETMVVLAPFQVQIPGIDHPIRTSTLPYFNCPMGTFSLDNKLTVERVDFKRRTGVISNTYVNNVVRRKDQYAWYSSYRIADETPISYSYNKRAGLELVGVQAALCARITNGTSQILFGPDNEVTLPVQFLQEHYNNSTANTGISTMRVSNLNFVLADIEANRLLVSDYDTDNKLHTVQTQYADINCLRGLALNIPWMNKAVVFVRVKAVFRKIGEGADATPIVFVNDYSITENQHADNETFVDTGLDATPPYTNISINPKTYTSSFTLPDGTYPAASLPNGTTVEVNKDIFINASRFNSGSTYVFRAGNSVVLGPGFTAVTGSNFTATTNYGYSVPCTGPAPVVNAYDPPDRPCGYDPNAYRLASKENNAPDQVAETGINVYPNPAEAGKFTFSFSAAPNSEAEVQLFNGQGKPVQPASLKRTGTSTYEVDLSNGAKGVYLLRVNTGSNVITKKVVVNN